MKLKTISSLKKLSGRKVLVRVDFNISVKSGKIASDYKILKSLPTIEFFLKKGAQVILVSHLGRPAGKDKKLSLKPVANRLSELLKKEVPLFAFSTSVEWNKIKEAIGKLKNGEVVMLENIRFDEEEEREGMGLSRKLAGLADIFVLDGFAVAHRKAASVSGVAKFIPAYAGLLLAEEISVLSKAIEKPKRPLVVLLGGAKADTKIPVLKNLLKVADHVLIGGGIFNTYLFASGKKVGKSLISKDLKKEIAKYCKSKKIVFPVDVIIGDPMGKKAKVVPVQNLRITNGEAIFDIGPGSVQHFAKYFKDSQTLIWNGAVGMFEQSPYHYGTNSLACLFAGRSKGKAVGICGGGETVEVLEKLKLMEDIDLVSTGGGAMLEFLSGTKLPGLKALQTN